MDCAVTSLSNVFEFVFFVGSRDDNRPFDDVWPGVGDIICYYRRPVVMTLVPVVMTFLSAVIMPTPTVITVLLAVRMLPAMMMTRLHYIPMTMTEKMTMTHSVLRPLSFDGYLLTDRHYEFLFWYVFHSITVIKLKTLLSSPQLTKQPVLLLSSHLFHTCGCRL